MRYDMYSCKIHVCMCVMNIDGHARNTRTQNYAVVYEP